MEVELIDIISQRREHTRFLVNINGDYRHSVLLSTGKYEKGTIVDITESIDDQPFKEEWLKKIKSWTSLKQKIYAHLAKYKENNLQETEKGYWEDSAGNKRYYSHILPDKKILKNIINSEYKDSITNSYNHKKSEIQGLKI